MAMMDWYGVPGDMMGYGGMWGFGIGAAILLIVNFIAVIWALSDVMKPKKMDVGIRISWVVIILALQLIGVLLYLFVGRRNE